MSEADPRPRREQIIAWARAARDLHEPERRHTVKGLVHEIYRTAPQSTDMLQIFPESDIFEAAYGDAGGLEYWNAWIFGLTGRQDFVSLLATHIAKSETEFRRILKKLDEQISRQPIQSISEDLNWLIQNPNTVHLVPDSLQIFVGAKPEPAPVIAEDPEPVTEDELKRFCMELPADERLTKSDAMDLAKSHFAPRSVQVRLFNNAFKTYPGKRLRGEHDAAIRRDKSLLK